MRSLLVVGCFFSSLATACGCPQDDLPCLEAEEARLPLPSSYLPDVYPRYDRDVLLPFLRARHYARLGWCRDEGVRDTGPFISGKAYGTHAAVRIYYSPDVMRWLVGGREGAIADGAMIVKEQFPPPAARWAGTSEEELIEFQKTRGDWVVMVKDSKGSKDGWYWTELFVGVDFTDGLAYPAGGFGQYCLRCHAVAEKESTFSSLRNIAGFPGEPVQFRVDDSWRDLPREERPWDWLHHGYEAPLPEPEPRLNVAFSDFFKAIAPVPEEEVRTFPPEPEDRVSAAADGPQAFLSSDQCQMCHSGLNGPFGPTMYLATGPPPPSGPPPGFDISPYGEWRWSPMGLAGRDPIFHAQLESELTWLATRPDAEADQELVRNLCLSCHGVMGKRQWDLDHPDDPNFQLPWVYATPASDPVHAMYGGLARDGVSCTACHRAVGEADYPLADFLANQTTGKFVIGEPTELRGPFEEVVPKPMELSLGITPKGSEYVKSSRLCGTCHTIVIPVIDSEPRRSEIEQATYLEWLNSSFQDEIGTPGPAAKSCQGCHMPGDYHDPDKKVALDRLVQRIAVIQDASYPESEFHLPAPEIDVRLREEGYVRHELLGANAFLLEMFRQFNELLGVRTDDFMSGSKTNLSDTLDRLARQAREETAQLAIDSADVASGTLTVNVSVTNLTGHRLPSGVGFRRAFLELVVTETNEERDASGAIVDIEQRVVWGSGRSNSIGLIVDGAGQPLSTEIFPEGKCDNCWQPHYHAGNPITREDQVQIFEEITLDGDGSVTTSFLRRDHEEKDNRLLPAGWTKDGPGGGLDGQYLEATWPKGAAAQDPRFIDGRGRAVVPYRITLPVGVDVAHLKVTARLHYQSIPPYYLAMRFGDVPAGEATRRLYYLCSNLDLAGTHVEGWKLTLSEASADVKTR